MASAATMTQDVNSWDRWGISSLALVATVTVVLYFLAQAQERKRLPPGPRPWPVVGNLPVMTSGMPHQVLHKLATKYGSIMYLRLGSRPCFVISTAAAAREVFRQSNDAIFSNRPKSLMGQVLSDNFRTVVHAPYGPYWRQLRRFYSSELMSPKIFESYRGLREKEVGDMMAVLVAESAKGEPVNVKSWLFELGANIITRMLVNKRYFGSEGASLKEKQEISQLFVELLRLVMVPVIGDFVPSLSFLTKLQGKDKLMKDRCDDALRVVGKMTELEKHRERAKERALQGNPEDYVPDFVDMITAAPLDDGNPLPDKTISLILLEVLVGGTDSGATAAEWAMAELMAHPHLMKRAQDDLDAVVGRDRLMQETDIPNLPFLEAIVKETFRLHPPGPLGNPRASSEATEACGYEIPAGSQLILNLRAIQRDPTVYENPDEFNPQRFVDHPEVNHMSAFDSYELMPFGIGRRMCPSAIFGNTVVHLMLGNLVHGYDWSFPVDQSVETCRRDNLEETFGLSVFRKEPLRLLAQPRDHILSILRNTEVT